MRTLVPSKSAILAAVFACAGLGACADLQRATQAYAPAPVNVESPVAAAVVAAQTGPVPTPSFRDVPPKVVLTNQPTAFQWRRTIDALNRSGDDVTAWATENPSLAATSTDAFNTAAIKALKYTPADAPPENQAQISEGFAQGGRKDAAAPPPPK